MTEFAKMVIDEIKGKMDKSVEHLKDELRGIRTGRASPALVENIRVDYYGSPTSLLQLAQISVPEARMLAVKPFDQGALPAIEKALLKANLGMTPNSDGKVLRLALPALSEEQRKKLAVRVKELAEKTRVSLRNIRREGRKQIEQSQKDGDLSEDIAHDLIDEVQEHLKEHEKGVDQILADKTKEIMTI